MTLWTFRMATNWSDGVDRWFHQPSRTVTKPSSLASSLHPASEQTTRISNISVNKFLEVPQISIQLCSILTMEYQSTLRTSWGKHKRSSLVLHKESASTTGARKGVNCFDVPKMMFVPQKAVLKRYCMIAERISLDVSMKRFLLTIILTLSRNLKKLGIIPLHYGIDIEGHLWPKYNCTFLSSHKTLNSPWLSGLVLHPAANWICSW